MTKDTRPLILICDDEEGVRESFKLILEDSYTLEFAETGMAILEKQDITLNVLEALRRDSERKLGLIQRSVNKRLIGIFQEFAAIEGSEVFDNFKNGTAVYLRYALQK